MLGMGVGIEDVDVEEVAIGGVVVGIVGVVHLVERRSRGRLLLDQSISSSNIAEVLL